MEYEFHKKEGESGEVLQQDQSADGERSEPAPPFDPAKFPVPGGISVPLAELRRRQYRLAIKISDKVSGKVLTRDVNFTVKAS